MNETTRQNGGSPQKHTDSSTATTFTDAVDAVVHDDPLWSMLERTANQTLFDPANHGPFAEQIEAHLEAAADELTAAAELRRASITATVVGEAGRTYHDGDSVNDAEADELVAALEARGYDVVKQSDSAGSVSSEEHRLGPAEPARTDGGEQ